jgi:tRNA(Ile)-lysidine synthase
MIVSDVVAQHVTDPLDVDELRTLPSHLHRPIIREFLKRGMGFAPSYVDVQRTLDLLDAETGSHVTLSGNHLALRERTAINLAPGTWHESPGTWHLALGENKAYVAGSQRLDVRTVPVQDVEILPDPHVAYIDADRLNGPLVWRPWEDGDRFVPFGMHGSVLVSDLLTNAKVPFSTRRTHRVVADADGIVWLCGIRPAERTRVTASTTAVLILTTKDY